MNNFEYLIWYLRLSLGSGEEQNGVQYYHGLINYVDTKSKCRHLNKFTCKGTLCHVFVKVEFRDWKYMQSYWYFRPSFVNCCPSNLLSGSTLLPPPLSVWISLLNTRIQCVRGGGYGVLGLRQIDTCRKVPLQVNFLTFCIAFYESFLSTSTTLSNI